MAQSKRAKVANYLCRLNFRSPLGSANKINGFCGDGRARPPLKPPFQWGDQKGPRGDPSPDYPISAFASKARAVSRSATRSTRAFSIFAKRERLFPKPKVGGSSHLGTASKIG